MTRHEDDVELEARAPLPSDVQASRSMLAFQVPLGLPRTPDEAWHEIYAYVQVLTGNAPPPVRSPYLEMMEVATAYLARGLLMDALILQAERDGRIERGSAWQKFRTGELDRFLSMCRRAADLGSRRLTQEQVLADMRGSL